MQKNGGWSELAVVQDADRLDAIGAFGVSIRASYLSLTKSSCITQIMRCSAYSSATNRPLYVPANIAGAIEDGNGQEAHKALVDSSAIQHFHDKLLHIKDRMKVRMLLCGNRLTMPHS